MEQYSSVRRYCVFSHDELVCRMANNCENINSKLAAAAYMDMINMAKSERKMRHIVMDWVSYIQY